MKKLYLFPLLFLNSFFLFAQFPGDNVNLFKNAELKVKDLRESSRQYGYSNFYKKETMSHSDIYASKNFASAYESLVNKVFKVLEVKPFTDSSGERRYLLKLANEETGILYFNYNPKFEYDYHFEFVKMVNLPDDFYCKGFAKDNDSGVTTIVSPYEDGILFTKFKEKKGNLYYIEVNVYSTTFNNAPKGLTLTLENEKTISHPEETVKVEAKDGGYNYLSYTELTDADITMLLQNKIKKVKLDAYEATVEENVKLQEYIKCLKKQ